MGWRKSRLSISAEPIRKALPSSSLLFFLPSPICLKIMAALIELFVIPSG